MMERIFLFVWLLIPGLVFGQHKVEPTIVVLYPNAMIATGEIQHEIKMYEQKIEITEADKAKFVHASLSPGWKLIREKELDFRSQQDFLSGITLATQTNLIYKIMEHHSDPLIFPVRLTSNGDLKNYKTIADDHKVAWVINYVSVELTQAEEKKYLKTRVHLYNAVIQRLFLNKEYIADAHSVNEEFPCENEGWGCAVRNLLPSVLNDLLHEVERNRRYWHK